MASIFNRRRILLVLCPLVLGTVAMAYFVSVKPKQTIPPARSYSPVALDQSSRQELPAPDFKSPETETLTSIAIEPSEKQIDNFPDTVKIRVSDQEFSTTYTGMFTRSRNVLFVPVSLYSIASYVEEPKAGNSNELLDRLLSDGPRKVYILRFLKPLPGNQILNAIREEIDATFQDVDMERLKENIDNFVQIFAEGSSTGDEVYMVWLPQGRLYCSFKKQDELKMIAQDIPLARAIWRIWAGEQSGEERLSLVERFSNQK